MNIIIIGAGPAGEAAAKTLRRLDKTAEITLIEREEVGGLCLNKGCVPSKALLEYVHQRRMQSQTPNWADLQSFKRNVVEGIQSQLKTSLKNLKINVLYGNAEFENPSSVKIVSSSETKNLGFDKAIIATGTESFFPPPFDAFRKELWDSEKTLQTEKTPKSIAVIGGGAVGCEFACLMNALGSKVTIIELTEGLLPGEDEAIVSSLTRSFESRGIIIRVGTKVSQLKKTSQGWNISTSQDENIEVEEILVSVGRVPSHQSLKLEKAGVKMDRTISVNNHFQTSNPNIYAIGDVAGTRLAHAAASQAEIAASNVLGETKTWDDRFVPRCLYSWPEVASVGTWKYAREKEGKPVKTTRAFFQGSAKALAAGETEGFVQIVFDPTDNRILGAQIIGPHATELIHVFSVALKKEMTVKELGEVMFAHPTLSEVIKDAARK